MFGEDLAYVALGHLHRAQAAGRDNIRYSGSAIPLSFPERTYDHQVLEVVIEGPSFGECTEIPVPRTRQILRIPEQGALPVGELLARLAALPAADGAAGERPLLEVAARLERPEPGLRHDVERSLEGRHVQLVAVTVELEGQGRALGDVERSASLEDVEPEAVLRAAWKRSFEGDPPDPLLGAFHELVDQVMQESER
jgi:exonuclease SbcD